MIMEPKISILLPVYNGSVFLKNALESILNQTFEAFEFIIIDDGSTDGTPDILNEYAKCDKRIRILRNSDNKKIVYSLNKGLKNARTTIVARMDCDDISEKDRLEKQYNILAENKDIVVVGTQCYFLTREGKIRSRSNFPTDDPSIRRELFLKNNIIMHPSVMFRWNGDIYYREFAYPAEDYDLWLRLAHRGKFVILNEPLLKIRLISEGTTFSKRIEQLKKVDEIYGLLIERLKFNKEVTIPNNKFEYHNRIFNELITSGVIANKKWTLKWLFFTGLAYLLHPKMLYEKLRYYIKRAWCYRNPLFIKFLEHEK